MKTFSKEFKAFFIAEFTKELIKNAGPLEVFELKEILDDKKEEEIEAEKKLEEHREETIKQTIQRHNGIPPYKRVVPTPPSRPLPPTRKIPQSTSIPITPHGRNILYQQLRIPNINLPPRLEYIRPTPRDRPINLGKLNPLIQDPNVLSIECHGSDKNIVVRTRSGTKNTQILLTESEIRDVLNEFSNQSKIPLGEEIIKIVYGRLILSAITSNIIDSKFIIQKMRSTTKPPPHT